MVHTLEESLGTGIEASNTDFVLQCAYQFLAKGGIAVPVKFAWRPLAPHIMYQTSNSDFLLRMCVSPPSKA